MSSRGICGCPSCHSCSQLPCLMPSCCAPRACWSRVFAMALFVEHVLFGICAVMPEFEGLARKYTLLLAKVSQAVISPLPSSAGQGNSGLRCCSCSLGFVLSLCSVSSTIQT